MGAGLGAGGAGAGRTATAGPLQGALQDGLSSPQVRVAARMAEHSDYPLKTCPPNNFLHLSPYFYDTPLYGNYFCEKC